MQQKLFKTLNLSKKSIVFFKPFPIVNYCIQFNSSAKRLQVTFIISLGHKTVTFHDFSISSLEWQFSFWYCIYSGKQITRGSWSGLGKAWSGSDPTAQCVPCKVRWHCIFYDGVSDTIRRRGGYRGIITEEGVDTVTYFGGNSQI